MTISSGDMLEGLYRATQALGTKSVNSDAQFEVEGRPDMTVLIEQFPWPTLGSQGEIEYPLPLGMRSALPQQINTYQQGPIRFSETISGSVMNFMKYLISVGGVFNGAVYEGTSERFTRGYKLVGCFFVPDATDRDWENRTQLMKINGTLHFNFFGAELTPTL